MKYTLGTKTFPLALLSCAALTQACGGDSTSTTTGTSTTSSTSTTTSGTGGGTTTATTGTGGAGGEGGGGGQGGAAPSCLDAGSISKLFTIEQSSLCAVAIYDADEMIVQSFQVPSWGTHGGPLTIRPTDGGAVNLVRWTKPAGVNGKLTAAETKVETAIPAGAFVGSQALDLPFFGWTAIVWSGAFPNTLGEVILAKGAAVDKRYAVNGAFAIGGLQSAPGQGRLLLTALAPVDEPTAGANGLYAADTCGNEAMPSLLPGNDPSCKAPAQVAAWGDASGPIAVDHDGNVFVVMSSFSGDQEARGFASNVIAPGAPASPGATMFTLPGFGAGLAALAPKGAAKGLLAFQPIDGVTFSALDVVGQAYSVAGGAVTTGAEPAALLKLSTAGTSVALLTDDQEQIWVAVPTATGTTFVVLARKP